MATIRDIAAAVGVSVATVSNVLNDRPNVGRKIRWTEVVTPRLTTIAQPIGAIGAKAVELLRERMSGVALVNRRTLFDVTLVERDSVKRLR
jgi:DNA-binding LacI/PurR family transcriptional regulator